MCPCTMFRRCGFWTKTAHIEGTVEIVLYKNQKMDTLLLTLMPAVTHYCCGDLGDVEEGEGLILEGQYITHKIRYSVQG